MNPARRADVTLIAACFLWGVSFVIVKDALMQSTPLAFLAMRFALATAAFAPFAGLGGGFSRAELGAGALLALLLGVGFIAQTVGLVYTTPSRSAFIVGVSSVLAPPIAMITLKERPRAMVIVALVLAAFGIWLLTNPDAGGLNRGDAVTLITAVSFGGQIVAVAALSSRHSVIRLLWLQMAGAAVLAAVGAPLFESVRVTWTAGLIGAVLFTALGATVLALFLQLRAQSQMSSSRAAVIFCSETLFAALTSWIVLGEKLTLTQWIGGALIIVGMVAVEWRRAPV